MSLGQLLKPIDLAFVSGIEVLEDRSLLSQEPLLVGAIQINEPGQEIARSTIEPQVEAFQFSDGKRWSSTFTNGSGLSQGDPITLRWGIVTDGTSISAGIGGTETTNGSSLIQFMDGLYGDNGIADNGDLTQKPWFSIFSSAFDRLGQVSGLTYSYLAINSQNTSFVSITNSLTSSATIPEILIGGHSIDGQSGGNVLAYNYFPNTGDMVIDTDNTTFFGDSTNSSIGMRNVLMHEVGHGVGIDHVESSDGSFLMEPFVSTSFDGPQLDDILALQRGYGDALEKNGGNNTSGTATSLGTINAGGSASKGTAGDSTVVSAGTTDFVSIDDESDLDFFSFTVAAGADVTLTLTPRGTTYLQGPQGGPEASFNSAAQSDLTLQLLDTNGTTVLNTANATGVGGSESINSVVLSSAGTYFARVSGATTDKLQLYGLSVSVAAVSATFTASLDGSGNLVLGDNTGNANTLTLKSNTANSRFEVTDSSNVLSTSIAGATGSGTNTLFIPFSSVTGSQILVNAQGGDDSLTLDFSQGNFSKAISYDGGTQTTSDSLTLTGGSSFTTVTHTLTSASAGSIAITGNSTISYLGLEPVTDNLDAVNRVFTFTGGAETITVTDGTAADGKTNIDSTLSESIYFANPTGSLTINAGTGNDTVTITSVDAGYNVDLTINGDAGDDTVNLNGSITFAANENLDVNLTNDASGGDVDNVNVTSGAVIATSGTGTINLQASRRVLVNNASTTLSTVNGGITLIGNSAGTTTGNFRGVQTGTSTVVRTTGTGSISITGKGGNDATTSNHEGVTIFGVVESTSAAAGAGTITINGTGGISSSGGYGIRVNGTGSRVSSVLGNVTLTGQGETTSAGTGDLGVAIWSNTIVEVTGGASLTVTGTAGDGSSDGFGIGIQDNATVRTTSSGNVTLVGTGSTGGVSGLNATGILVNTGSVVTSTGSGNLLLRGIGGSGAFDSFGIQIGQGATVATISSTSSGTITLQGKSGTGGNSVGISLETSGSTITSSGTGSVTLAADNISLQSGTAISAGLNVVTLRPATKTDISTDDNGDTIDIGSTSDTTGPSNNLQLSDAELDLITAGRIVIGNSSAGAVTFSGNIIDMANCNVLEVITGSTINDTGTSTVFIDTSLALNAAAGIGTSNGPLNTQVSNLAATAATGGISVHSDTGASLSLTTVGGVTGVTTTTSGNVSISALGSITVSQPVSVVGSGTLLLDAQFGDAGDIIVNNTVTTVSGSMTLRADDDISSNASGTLTTTSGAVTITADDDATSSGTITYTAAINHGSNGSTWSLADADGSMSGVISGTGGLTKNGNGTLTLSGTSANTFSGTTTVNAGTLSLSKTAGVNAIGGNLTIGNGSGTDTVKLINANQIPDTTDVTTATGGVLNLNGQAETIDALNGTGSVTSSVAGAVTLTVGANNDATASFSGAIANGSGTVALAKTGSGTQTLSGASTYSGTTSVNAGTLNVQNASALGSTAGNTVVASGASLEIQGGINVSEPLTLNGTGVSGGGALRNINSNNYWSGAITLASNATIGGSSSGGGNELVLFGATGETGGARSLTINGGISLVMQSAAANTYTGTTYVLGAALRPRRTGDNGTIIGPLVIGDGSISSAVLLDTSNQLADSVDVTVNANGTLALGPFGSVSETIDELSGNGVVEGAAAGATDSLAVGANNGSSTFSGVIQNAGSSGTTLSLTKTGNGTQTLAGTNTYTGTTTISAGTLSVTGSLASGSAVTVQSGGTLGGTGTVAGTVNVQSGGTVAPGTSPGILNSGSVTFTSSSVLAIEIAGNGGAGDSNGHDQLNVTGTVSLGSATLTLNTTGLTAAEIPSGQTFVIINNDSTDAISGIFNGFAEGATVLTNVAGSGCDLKISYVGGTNGNDVVLIAVNSVTLDGSNNLVVTDANGGTTNDTLTIQSNTSTNVFVIYDPNNTLTTSISGATGSGTHTVTVPFASVSGSQILVNTLGGNDSLTVDLSLGNFSKSISYDGGTQTTSDSLTLTGGSSFATVTHTLTNSSTGTIAITGNSTISYTGLEPITDNLSATDRVFTFNGGAETITVTDGTAADGKTNIDSTLSESIYFTNPTGSLTINAGTGNDTVTVTSVDAAYHAALTINGDAGNDTVNLNTSITFAADNTLDVNLTNDGSGGDVDRISVGAGASLVTSGMGTILLQASREVSLATGSSLSTINGGITLAGNAAGTTADDFNGIVLDVATITTSGTGTISITGQSGTTSTVNTSYGVQTKNGAIIQSTASGLGAGEGTITISGTSHGTAGIGTGVRFNTSSGQVTSVSGDIQITGVGADAAGQNQNIGVDNEGLIESTGTAHITIMGTGGLGQNVGRGVNQTGTTRSTGSGNIQITGTANGSDTGDNNAGILLLFGTVQSTGSGNIVLEGTGGGGTFSNSGVWIHGGANVTSSGSGTISITGTGGAGTGTHGVLVQSSSMIVSTKDSTATTGNITITGTAGSNASSVGIALLSGAKVTTRNTTPGDGTAYVILIADSMTFDMDAVIDVGSKAVALNEQTIGTLINLGGADAVGTLGLTDAELDRITAGQLVIGDYLSGAITVCADIDLTDGPVIDVLTLNTGSTLTATAGGLSVAGLEVIASGAVTITDSTTDVDTLAIDGSGNITFVDADGFAVGSVGESVGGVTTAGGFISLTATTGDITINNTFALNDLFATGVTGSVTITLSGNDAKFTTASGSSVRSQLLGITVNADKMDLGGTLNATTAGQSITLQPGNGADAIDLGSGTDVAVNTLELSDAELDRINAEYDGGNTCTIQIGSTTSGTITVSSDLTLPGKNLTLTTAAGVSGTGGITTGSTTATTITINQSGNSTYSGVLGGTGTDENNFGLTKSGTGALTLSGANTYSGGTTVSAGRLNVNGSTASGSAVTVQSGATLGGTGAVAGTVSVQSGGHVAPGTSPGIVNNGSVSFASGSFFDVEIGGTTPGNAATNHDQLVVTGTVALGGATLTTTAFNSFVPVVGNTFAILLNDGTDDHGDV
jgi:autotransporter-associated beta strand protein